MEVNQRPESSYTAQSIAPASPFLREFPFMKGMSIRARPTPPCTSAGSCGRALRSMVWYILLWYKPDSYEVGYRRPESFATLPQHQHPQGRNAEYMRTLSSYRGRERSTSPRNYVRPCQICARARGIIIRHLFSICCLRRSPYAPGMITPPSRRWSWFHPLDAAKKNSILSV